MSISVQLVDLVCDETSTFVLIASLVPARFSINFSRAIEPLAVPISSFQTEACVKASDTSHSEYSTIYMR